MYIAPRLLILQLYPTPSHNIDPSIHFKISEGQQNTFVFFFPVHQCHHLSIAARETLFLPAWPLAISQLVTMSEQLILKGTLEGHVCHVDVVFLVTMFLPVRSVGNGKTKAKRWTLELE